MKFLEFRLELKNAYFYSPRTDAPYQLTVSKKRILRDKIRIKILETEKSRTINWWLCPPRS